MIMMYLLVSDTKVRADFLSHHSLKLQGQNAESANNQPIKIKQIQ